MALSMLKANLLFNTINKIYKNEKITDCWFTVIRFSTYYTY